MCNSFGDYLLTSPSLSSHLPSLTSSLCRAKHYSDSKPTSTRALHDGTYSLWFHHGWTWENKCETWTPANWPVNILILESTNRGKYCLGDWIIFPNNCSKSIMKLQSATVVRILQFTGIFYSDLMLLYLFFFIISPVWQQGENTLAVWLMGIWSNP